MRLALLGSLQLVDAGERIVTVSAAKRRAVLAALALELNRTVSVDRLLELVWDGDPPASARTALQGHIHALRKVLKSPLSVETRCGGYALAGDPLTVDLYVFSGWVAEAGAAKDEQDSAALLRRALDLWRGPVFADVPSDHLQQLASDRYEQARVAALESWSTHLIRANRGEDALESLVEGVRQHPLRESLIGMLMSALHQGNRPAQAVEVYHNARRRLADELSVAPGPVLQQALQMALQPTQVISDRGNSAARPERRPRTVPAQLPREPVGFTGRDAELSWLEEQEKKHASAGLTLVVGPAGIGKTSLVLHWAHQVAHRYPDGHLFMNLRGFDETEPVEPGAALAGLLDTLGVDERTLPESIEDRAALFRSTLADQRVLIILDNARSAEQVRPLLPPAQCAVVVTSRRRLSGLIAQEGAAVLSVTALSDADALQLLAKAFGAASTAAESGAARQLVALCDHLPLALRLAAARLTGGSSRPIQLLVDELANEHERLELLATVDEEISVEAALALTYRTLTPTAGALLRFLGLYAGVDIDVQAAAALVRQSRAVTLQALNELLTAHLVTENAEAGQIRYGWHDLVRLYTRRLANDLSFAERDQVYRRLFDYYLYVTAAAYNAVAVPAPDSHGPIDNAPITARTFSGSLEAVEWFRTEEASLRELLLAGQKLGYTEHVWKIVDNIGLLYRRWGLSTHHVLVTATGLRAAQSGRHSDGVLAMSRRAGVALHEASRHDEAADRFSTAVEMAREVGTTRQRYNVLTDFIMWAREAKRWDEFDRAAAEVLGLAKDLGDPIMEAITHNEQACTLVERDLPEDALAHATKALQLLKSTDRGLVYGGILHTYGCVLQLLGKADEALAVFLEASEEFDTAGDLRKLPEVLLSLGETLSQLGRNTEAKERLLRALGIADQFQLPLADDVRRLLAQIDDRQYPGSLEGHLSGVERH